MCRAYGTLLGIVASLARDLNPLLQNEPSLRLYVKEKVKRRKELIRIAFLNWTEVQPYKMNQAYGFLLKGIMTSCCYKSK